MAITYPATLDAPATFGTPAGTSLVTSPDHAQSHTDIATALGTIEVVVGTTSGTNVLKNFTAGKLGVYTPGGTLVTGMVQNGTVGTALMQGGTVANAIVGTSTIAGGTLGTPTLLGPLNASGTSVPITMGAALAPNEGSLTDTVSGTLTANAQAANIYYCVMGTSAGNRTIGTPANAASAVTLTYAFKSSGSANGTLVWQSAFVFSQNTGTPAIGTGTSWNYYAWRYNRIDSKWHFQGQSKNVI